MKKICLIVSGIILLTCIFIYSNIGIFVIQPIGMIPEGISIVYWRSGTKLPFLSSADGLLLKTTGEVSILGRMVMLGKMSELLEKKTITKLPYSEWFYLKSTGGVKFAN